MNILSLPLRSTQELEEIKVHKATGPDEIPNKILKELSHILAEPICAIINSSIRQGIVPEQWKISRITLLPKIFPPNSVENDIRPIAKTNVIAKIAERFISRRFNEFFNENMDKNQFGCVNSRSTSLALLKLTHEWFKASDKSNNIIRILFVDFTKAFDLIDHNILLKKFVDYAFPPHITV